MIPSDLFNWSLAIGLAWAVFVFFIPIDRWLAKLIGRALTSDLEKRVAVLEQRLNKEEDHTNVTPSENSGS
ncbi:MAG: hypothetical protein KDK97_14940 [Verrucomicrobiales bacterium]|nr:hypothetical protein [Verrucomicrobiales bacterium]MCP5560194.1 hypothetical protein [Verrucomicrobiaceae bacterium]